MGVESSVSFWGMGLILGEFGQKAPVLGFSPWSEASSFVKLFCRELKVRLLA